VVSAAYRTASPLDQLARAQAEIDRHVAVSPDGRCLGCGAEAPCAALRAANATFLRYGRLPARRPGLASHAAGQTHQASGQTRHGFGWFAG
jgi:hypothetical protein